MHYRKSLNGVDNFGNTHYDVVFDECVPNSLINYLDTYSILSVKNLLNGFPDWQVSLIALLNKSVLITYDVGLFFQHNHFKKILVGKKTPFKRVKKTLDILLRTEEPAYPVSDVLLNELAGLTALTKYKPNFYKGY